jgi:hypothetical protein
MRRHCLGCLGELEVAFAERDTPNCIPKVHFIVAVYVADWLAPGS